ncbi:epoxide hydrolase 1-like [Oppia nitens]|uniref:epoxide hydrolase 1-like n=1 Tax=Oppia nitens TaxID=1686743 RepID=UPI0023D9C42F|nr:epoxide hydrolase 1-like [Oppia nitens]
MSDSEEEDHQSNKQLMLFIHGFPEFWYSWRHQIREFSPDYRTLAVDLRGYGLSDKPLGCHNYTLDLCVEDIWELVASIYRNRLHKQPIVLVGHDWGGLIGWKFTGKYPQLVDRLIVLNSPHPQVLRDSLRCSPKQFFSSWYMYFFNLPLLPELVLLSNDLQLFDICMVAADGHPMFSRDDMDAYKYVFSRSSGLTGPLNYYRAFLRRRRSSRKYPSDRPKNIMTIKVPTLIIWGKRDIAFSEQLATDAHRYVQDLTVQYIDNCSHWTQLDQPMIVNQYIRQYLNK